MHSADKHARGDKRSNVILRASVEDSRGKHDVSISDVSSQGVLCNMANPPRRGEFITLVFPSQEVAGHVRWVKGREFGVELHEKLVVDRLFSGSRAPRQKGKSTSLPTNELAPTGPRVAIIYAVLGTAALGAAYLVYAFIVS